LDEEEEEVVEPSDEELGKPVRLRFRLGNPDSVGSEVRLIGGAVEGNPKKGLGLEVEEDAKGVRTCEASFPICSSSLQPLHKD
jgi:hypothetical protein